MEQRRRHGRRGKEKEEEDSLQTGTFVAKKGIARDCVPRRDRKEEERKANAKSSSEHATFVVFADTVPMIVGTQRRAKEAK